MIYRPVEITRIFEELFATIPAYDGNYKLVFNYGEQVALNTFLLDKQKNQEPTYPLLWYNLPSSTEGNGQYEEGVFQFVLAHNTKFEFDNPQRFNQVIHSILYPHFSLVMQALNKANGISVLNFSGTDKKYQKTDYPNYGVDLANSEGTVQKAVDIWDAIGFKVRLNIKANACQFDKIKYDLNNI